MSDQEINDRIAEEIFGWTFSWAFTTGFIGAWGDRPARMSTATQLLIDRVSGLLDVRVDPAQDPRAYCEEVLRQWRERGLTPNDQP